MAFWNRWIFVRASSVDEQAAGLQASPASRSEGRLASSCDAVVFDRVAWVSERAAGREIMIVRTRRSLGPGPRR